MILADQHTLTMFVARLLVCEEAVRLNLLSNWKIGFVSDIRDKFDSRESAMDLGVSPWNPTKSQWDMLAEISMDAKQAGVRG